MKSAKSLGSVGKPKQEVVQFGITHKIGTGGYEQTQITTQHLQLQW
jgi:hypothetical protein